MSKAVLMSIKPKWAEKIFEGKKTIEIRRTRPSIPTPFKVFVYETKAQFVKSIRGACTTFGYGRGKVIGSFVCDKIDEYEANERGWYIYPQDETCLWTDEIAHYGKGKTLYGWHITEPKLFDKPRELFEFYAPCRKGKETADESCKGCSYAFKGVATGVITCDNAITRPPQSFCYVDVDE